jgi:hypothetical protein
LEHLEILYAMAFEGELSILEVTGMIADTFEEVAEGGGLAIYRCL